MPWYLLVPGLLFAAFLAGLVVLAVQMAATESKVAVETRKAGKRLQAEIDELRVTSRG